MKMKPSHLVGGFRGAGLWSFNPEAVRAEKIIEVGEEHPWSSQACEEEPVTPRKLLREAIVCAIAPPLSAENQHCVENSAKRRKRVQAKYGEVMTSEDVVERLRLEEIARKEKAAEKGEFGEHEEEEVYAEAAPIVRVGGSRGVC